MTPLQDPNKLVIDVINACLSDVVVSTELPPEGTQSLPYIMVSRTGGTDSEFVLSPVMTLMCWESTDSNAYSLAIAVKEALQKAAEDHPYLSSVEFLSLSRDQWSASGQSRYALQVRLTINVE